MLYAYCVGVFSSRKIALACERNLAFVAIVGPDRPDFRTISDFRKRHLEAFKDVFVQVVRLAAETGLVQLGNVSTDGTKIQGNASRHKAMSYGYMKKAVERVREDIEALVTQAHQQDESDDAALGSRRGDELPADWRAVGIVWRGSRRPCAAWRRRPRRKRLTSVSAELTRKRNATDGQETARQSPATGGGEPRRQGPEQFYGSRAAYHADQNKGWEYCGDAQAMWMEPADHLGL